MMFIPLEGDDLVYVGRTVAFVREGDETAIYMRDGSVMATGFTPRTLARRYRQFTSDARQGARKIRRGGTHS
ncbi:MAG: hypothetical protein K9L28_06205 [Synergistales bacterium]|nr:hypothetical protein [Synergistales bacterium]